MIIAFDYGEKRIGVAISDESNKFARALNFIPNRSEVKKVFLKDFPKGTDIKVIQDIRKARKKEAQIELKKVFNKMLYYINLYYPNKIIVGVPKIIDQNSGEWFEGTQAKKIRTFFKKFHTFLQSKKVICEIEFIDETMTTHLAKKNLNKMNLSKKSLINKIDSESARILLQEYLSKI